MAPVRSFTIITGDANEQFAHIHNRMPVILDPPDYARWLGEEPASSDELLGFLRPYPAEKMRIYPIGLRIGSVKNDDAALIEPASGALMAPT